MTLLLGNYEGETDIRQRIVRDWDTCRNEDIEPFEVLVAGYWEGSYEGYGWLLLRRRTDGELFELSVGHCSCHGLEWSDPGPTSRYYLLSKSFPLKPLPPESNEDPADATKAERLAIRSLVESLPVTL